MKDFLLITTYIIGVGELVLALYFWFTNSKNTIRRVMALLSFTTGLWLITSAATSYVGQNTLTTFYMQVVFVSAIFLITALLHLGIIFPSPIRTFDRLHTILLYVPAFIFSVIIFSTQAVVIGFTGSPTESGRIIPGELYKIYNLYILLAYLCTLTVLWVKNRRLDGFQRKNVLIFWWSLVLGGIVPMIVDVLIPVFTNGIYPNALFGNISTVIWVGAVTIILLR